jgi:CRISPR system Cascade subunit CasE
MYLTRLILNPRHRRVQREIAEPYQMHRSIMRAFPEDLDREQERVLFRLEAPRGGAPLLLVQSLAAPDWSWLDHDDGARGYLLADSDPNPWVKDFQVRFEPGQVLAFRLRANPTVKRRGKRLGLYRSEEQLDWLTRKAQEGGFRLLSARAGEERAIGGVIRRKSHQEQLRLLSVCFDGLLQVLDPQRLTQAVERGIGSGKGLGFGLLSLARPGVA